METARSKIIHYKRSHFATQLPVDCLYSPSHYWIARLDPATVRVGLTKFATRMLGEMVDHGFEVEPGAALAAGQILGWVEGFKAISDVFCVAEGTFAGSNPALKEKIALMNKDCYGQGWLYEVTGRADERCIDVQAYVKHLDKTIDRILEKQKNADIQ